MRPVFFAFIPATESTNLTESVPRELLINQSAHAWTNYWKSGRHDTCFTGGGAFSQREYWRRVFAGLAPGTALLDLATGNGAVAVIAAEVSEEQNLNLEIHGVDQADINPESEFDIQFLGNTEIESMPYADGQFAAVTSQFGFEYSDTNQAIGEISRITGAGARVHLLVHAKQGEVHRQSEERLKRVRELVNDRALPELALSLAQLPVGSNRLSKAEKKFQSKAAAMYRRLEGAPPDDVAGYALKYLADIAGQISRYDLEDYRRCVRELTADLKAYMIRLNAMLRAARDEAQMREIKAAFGSLGFEHIATRPLMEHGEQIAWILTAEKNTGANPRRRDPRT